MNNQCFVFNQCNSKGDVVNLLKDACRKSFKMYKELIAEVKENETVWNKVLLARKEANKGYRYDDIGKDDESYEWLEEARYTISDIMVWSGFRAIEERVAKKNGFDDVYCELGTDVLEYLIFRHEYKDRLNVMKDFVKNGSSYDIKFEDMYILDFNNLEGDEILLAGDMANYFLKSGMNLTDDKGNVYEEMIKEEAKYLGRFGIYAFDGAFPLTLIKLLEEEAVYATEKED